MNRRELIRWAVAAPLVLRSFRLEREAPLFRISLAEWSFHRCLWKQQKPHLDHLDFPKRARRHGIDAVEYVSTFFDKEKGTTTGYLEELRKRCAGEGVESVLIMVDGEGALGDPDEKVRVQAVENHRKWLVAAKHLGCHSIRVNARSRGPREEQAKLAADGLARLAKLGGEFDLNVIVENHGGFSSDGSWLSGVIRSVGDPRLGTLPDFGNFHIRGDIWYDRYKGVKEMMPFAKGVSAKSHDFDATGNETHTDYRKMLRIVLAAGYHGRIGIEYEGGKLSETEGVNKTKALLETVRKEIAAERATPR